MGKWQRQELGLDLSKPSAWNLVLSELKGPSEAIWPRGRLWKHTNLLRSIPNHARLPRFGGVHETMCILSAWHTAGTCYRLTSDSCTLTKTRLLPLPVF